MTALESHQAQAFGSKKIVICLDGTGNQMRARGHTNVATLYEMLDLSDPTRQLGYYDPGVGTMSSANARGPIGRRFSRLSGLAFGSGLRANLAEAYTFLMQHWRPGDELYVFGFSRGAYTARALVGMLNRPGLLRPGSENLVPYAVAHYATNKTFREPDKQDMREFSHAFCWGTGAMPLSPARPADPYEMHWHSVPVAYLGVWDTVKAAGILRLGNLHWPFTHQLFNARRIRHAVSIDEYRRPYHEYLADPKHFGLEEAWFAGVHSDVGGTFEDDPRLAKIALKWIVDGTVDDLRLRIGAYAQQCRVEESFAHGARHKMGKVWFLVGRRRRRLPDTAKLHASVRDRRRVDPTYPRTLRLADREDRWIDPNWTAPAIVEGRPAVDAAAGLTVTPVSSAGSPAGAPSAPVISPSAPVISEAPNAGPATGEGMTAMPTGSAVFWSPEDLPIPAEDLGAWNYVVLEELVDDLALLRRWPWPVVDQLGRLLWPDGAEGDSDAAAVGAKLLKAQLYGPNPIEREPRCGDTFAVPRGADERWRSTQQTMDLRDLLGDAVYDISADAREAAKIAYQSSLGAIRAVATADEDAHREVEQVLQLRAEEQLQPLPVRPPEQVAQPMGLQ